MRLSFPLFVVFTSIVTVASIPGLAEIPDDPSRPELQALRKEGSLVSVRVAPGDPLKVFVLGREEARLDLSKLKVTVRRLEPSPREDLIVRNKDGYYLIESRTGEKEIETLEVNTKFGEKSETFRFRLRTSP